MDKPFEISHSLLTVKELTTGYILGGGNKKVLHTNLNLYVSRGEFIALLGPNGVGKSTFIKVIAGLQSPLYGKIMLSDRDLTSMSNREIACEISLVLTNRIDDIYLTSYDIIKTGRYPYGSFMGKLSSEDKQLIANAIEIVGIAELSSRVYNTLSDGERQKVLIARAIAQNTDLIIMDEPTAFIDSPGKIEIMTILDDLVRNLGKSIVITTHDIEMAISNVDTLWLMGYDNEFISGNVDMMINEKFINRFFDRKGVGFNVEKLKFEKTQ